MPHRNHYGKKQAKLRFVIPVKTGIQLVSRKYPDMNLDSGPFGKPFETLRVPREIEGLRVPSLSRDFRRSDEADETELGSD